MIDYGNNEEKEFALHEERSVGFQKDVYYPRFQEA